MRLGLQDNELQRALREIDCDLDTIRSSLVAAREKSETKLSELEAKKQAVYTARDNEVG